MDEIRSVVWPILASSLIADFASDHGSSSESGFESAVSQFSDEEDTPSSSKTVVRFISIYFFRNAFSV